jgi:N-methylhydantoinase B
LWSLLLANSRTPELLDGDLRSMLGSVAIGVERLRALVVDLGLERAKDFIAEVLNHADRRMRAEIRALPDGVYCGEDISNNDCFETVDVAIRVALTIEGDRLTVDFAGTAPQIRGFKNSSLANTHSAVYVALSTFFGHEIPRNEGTFRCATVLAPEGSVVNPRPPAPMTMCTSFVAHEIIHACWKALGRADPARSIAGWGKQTVPITAGHTREGKPYVMFHWNELPGAGAVEGRDGFNEIGPMITLGGLSLSNVETYERLYPVTIWRESFREDGGGPGRFRGGTGVDYVVDVQGRSITSFRGEGLRTPSGFGAAGGRWGQHGVMSLQTGGTVLPAPQFDVREFDSFRMTASSPGGGGWGEPLERDPALVLRDVQDGVVSRHAAGEEYGVVLDAVGKGVDAEATRRLRQQVRTGAIPAERAAE